MGNRLRFVNVTYTQFQGKSVATRVSEEEAKTILVLIDNSKQQRQEMAKAIGQLLDNVKTVHGKKQAWHNFPVDIQVQGPHGVESQPPLPARLCVLVFYLLMAPNEAAFNLFKTQLQAFMLQAMNSTDSSDYIHASGLYCNRVPSVSVAPTITIHTSGGVVEA